MKELLTYIAKNLVNDPDAVSVTETQQGEEIIFELRVAPDDMVSAKFTGDKKLVDLQIKPEAVDPDDVDMLTDLVMAAVNDGLQKVDAATQQKLGKYTKGLGM